MEQETFKLASFELELSLKVSQLLLRLKDLFLLLPALPVQVIALSTQRTGRQVIGF